MAEAALVDAEDALKRAIFTTNDPAIWDDAHRSDRPAHREPSAVDLRRGDPDRAREAHRHRRRRARASRTRTTTSTSRRTRRCPPSTCVAATARRPRRHPVLDATTGEPAHRHRSPAASATRFSDVFGLDFPTWTLGFNFSYPILNRQARRGVGARPDQPATRRWPASAGWRCRSRSEVRSAARAVETNFKRVESTRAARVLQERRLDAEKEVRGRHVHELPGHPEPARPGRGRGGGAARHRRLPEEPRELRARAGGRAAAAASPAHRRRRATTAGGDQPHDGSRSSRSRAAE